MTELIFPPLQRHTLLASDIGQTFEIKVQLPVGRPDCSERWPVIYATDANILFDGLRGITQALQLSNAPEPRFILVGIGYPGESPATGLRLRARDLSYAGFPDYLTGDPPYRDALPGGATRHGGGQAFGAFIADQLVPFIDGLYPTIPGDRTYFGHSSGGSFGLHLLSTRPELFRRHIWISPALSFESKGVAGQMHVEEDFGLGLAERTLRFWDPGRPLDLYVAVGSEEEVDPAGGRWRFTSNFYRLAALLKAQAPESIRFRTEAFAQETHMSVWPTGFVHGARFVLGPQVKRA